MKSWDFTVILEGVADMTDALADALYEAGCDDATVCSSAGVASDIPHAGSNGTFSKVWKLSVISDSSAGLRVVESSLKQVSIAA